MSMKKSSDIIGNRTRDLPVCSAVPQPLRHRLPPLRSSTEVKERGEIYSSPGFPWLVVGWTVPSPFTVMLSLRIRLVWRFLVVQMRHWQRFNGRHCMNEKHNEVCRTRQVVCVHSNPCRNNFSISGIHDLVSRDMWNQKHYCTALHTWLTDIRRINCQFSADEITRTWHPT
jgi:hypothetical protein